MRNIKSWKYELIVKDEKFRYRTRNEITKQWGISDSSIRNILKGINSKSTHYNTKWQDIKINRIDILIPKDILIQLINNERVCNNSF